MFVATKKWAYGQPDIKSLKSPSPNPGPVSAGHPFINKAICLLAVLAVSLTGILGHDLWTPDEPRVAAIVLEMAQTGNFVIPHLAGVPFIEKPPLYFATAAMMLKLVGPVIGNTAAIRLTSAFFGLGVLLMTFLIARCLWGNKTGLLAAAVLATMDGFVEHFHWIVVDPALAFFVIAFTWCMVEVYFNSRRSLLPLGGLFLAGAFLSKGTIGPAMAFVPWIGLAAIWFLANREQGDLSRGFAAAHLWLVLVFGIISGVWIVSLYVKGGPALWNEWFWVNQIGRFTGEASKGHIKPGQPLYYVFKTMGYGLPWTPLFLYWIGAAIINAFKEKSTVYEDKNLFLYIWGAGSIVLLTLAATKRGLYLVPALPAFAIMTAVSLMKQSTSSWFKWYSGFWITISLIIMTVILTLPLVAGALPDSIPATVKTVLGDFNHYHIITGLWLAVCLAAVIRFRESIPLEYLMALATAGLLVSLLGVPVQAVDRQKSMAADVRQFISRIPESRRDQIAGYGFSEARQFSETMLGMFYFYSGWKVLQINDEKRIKQILSGHDNDYDSLLVNYRDKHGDLHPQKDLAPYPYRILLEMATGDDRDRKVFWIEGQKTDSASGGSHMRE